MDAADVVDFDAVVHLAELSNDPVGELDQRLTYAINHQGSVDLARTCKAAAVPRFVDASSCSVYGAGSEDIKTEDFTPNPQTAYATCKTLVERDVKALADERITPAFLRNATAYGASPRMRFDIVLNNLAAHARTSGELKMTSDGSPWRPLVHVNDICEAILLSLEAPREVVHNQVFNVGSDEQNYRIRDIAEIVGAAFPGCVVSYGPSSGDTRSYRVSIDKIRRHLPGYRCRRTAERALYIPAGFAHGFQTLEPECELFYQMSTEHVPEAASGVRHDDPAFAIAWPLPVSRLSPRDAAWPDFRVPALAEPA